MKLRRYVAVLGLALGAVGIARPARADITPTSDPAQLAAAISVDTAVVTGASFAAAPTGGTPNAVADSTTPLGGFPLDGSLYAVLTSGDATLADDANTSGGSGTAAPGSDNVRGDTDMDVTVLRIDLSVPTSRNCLSVDFRFLSEEFPEFVDSSYNDAFIAELDSSTWDTVGSTITAPDNFAFDPSGDVISINSSGVANMTTGDAAGTTYDGATALLRASTPVTPGSHSVYLSIFDQGDPNLDSAVFLDNLFLGAAPEGQCEKGATLPPPDVAKTAEQPSSPAGGTNGYTITVENPNESPVQVDSVTDTLPEGFAYVEGSTTGAVTGDPVVSEGGLTWAAAEGSLLTIPAVGSASFSFDVTVAATPGDYFNVASLVSGEDVVSTGDTALITVEDLAPPPTPPVGPPQIVSHCDPVSLSGTATGDKLTGTAGADRIRALAGRDVLDGLAGDDQLCGGDGGDYVYGRAGADTLRGEGSNDRLYGSRHGDALEGGPGHDALIAGKGADAILATDGAQDCILTGQGADTVAVDPGLDLVDPKGGCPAGFWL